MVKKKTVSRSSFDNNYGYEAICVLRNTLKPRQSLNAVFMSDTNHNTILYIRSTIYIGVKEYYIKRDRIFAHHYRCYYCCYYYYYTTTTIITH